MNLTTSQISSFKTLVTCLKDVLIETTMSFTPAGLKLTTMDKLKTTLVDVFAPSENFDFYDINIELIEFGVDTFQLHKCMNSIEADDILTLSVDRSADGICSCMTIQFENEKRIKVQSLKLIDPDTETFTMPEVEYSIIAKVPSLELKKTLKSLNTVSDVVEIASHGNVLNFITSGPFCDTKTELKSIDFQKSSNTDVHACYSLKSLSSFIKTTTLDENCDIFLSADTPLMVQYNIGKLGTLRLCLKSLP
jgi:proliferating cell nuclear antigen